MPITVNIACTPLFLRPSINVRHIKIVKVKFVGNVNKIWNVSAEVLKKVRGKLNNI